MMSEKHSPKSVKSSMSDNNTTSVNVVLLYPTIRLFSLKIYLYIASYFSRHTKLNNRLLGHPDNSKIKTFPLSSLRLFFDKEFRYNTATELMIESRFRVQVSEFLSLRQPLHPHLIWLKITYLSLKCKPTPFILRPGPSSLKLGRGVDFASASCFSLCRPCGRGCCHSEE